MEPQDWLSQTPTDVLIQITNYLTGYDKLCVRITCRRMYSILSDPRAWSSMIWRDCRKRDQDFKALKLALKLSRPCVKFVLITYNPDSMAFPLSKFIPQIYHCQVVHHLTLTGMPIVLSMLEKLLTKLPSLTFLSLSLGPSLDEKEIICAAAKAPNLHILRVSETSTLKYFSPFSQSKRHLQNSCAKAIHHWKNNNYVPSNLELCVSYIPFSYILEELTPCERPALLSIFPNCSPVAGNVIVNYSTLKVSLYPHVDIVTCPAQAVCSSHRGTHKFLLSPGEEPVSAIVYKHTSIESSVPTVSFLPTSLKLLCLGTLHELSSEDLTLICEFCPNLVCLDIHGCHNALLKLEGLSDIASSCLELASLNMKGIQKVESVALFWEILGRIKKLRYLALRSDLCAPDRSNAFPKIGSNRISYVKPFDMQSRSRILASVARLRLFALEIDYTFSSNAGAVNYIFPLYFETLLPGLYLLQHLRIFVSSKGIVNLTNILPNLPSLTHLSIVSEDDFPTMTLPTDPACYSALKKLSVFCLEPKSCLESNFIQAVCQSRTLTHLCLSTAEWDGFVGGIPQLLCECFIMVNHARRHGVHQHPIEGAGICGSLLYPKVGATYSLEKVKDLQSLFLFD